MSVRATFALVVLCGGCRVGPAYRAPEARVPAQWAETELVRVAEPARAWWRSFGDTHLDGLIERALARNLDVRIAGERIREARAVRAAVAGVWDPQVNAGGGVSRSESSSASDNPLGGRTANVFDAGFDARWEIDLFGRRDHALAAADAGVDVATEGRHGVVVSVLAEVARNYVDLRGVQRQIEITRSNLVLQRDTSELTSERFRAGLATDLDVARSESLVATTSAQLPVLEASARALAHSLSVLLGETPGAVERELASFAPIPLAPDTVDAGLPSELLRRRPDLRAAEREFARATAQTGEAVARMYPSFSLTASLGRQSSSFSDLFDADATAWSAGGALFAPILSGGSLRADVDASEARAEIARLAYQRAVLSALAEVDSALTAVARQRARQAALATALEADRRAVTLANDLYLRGIVSFFEVLEAQSNVLRSESSFAESSTDLAQKSVALYKALGGGWDPASP